MDQSGTPRVPSETRGGNRGEQWDPSTDDRQRRRLKRRALVDALLVLIAAIASATPVAEARDSLIVGVGALLVGILFFLVRRHNDLVEVARHIEPPLPYQGLSLSEWQAGAPLPSKDNQQPD